MRYKEIEKCYKMNQSEKRMCEARQQQLKKSRLQTPVLYMCMYVLVFVSVCECVSVCVESVSV